MKGAANGRNVWLSVWQYVCNPRGLAAERPCLLNGRRTQSSSELAQQGLELNDEAPGQHEEDGAVDLLLVCHADPRVRRLR